MANLTANEVSMMQTDLDVARTQIESMRDTIAMLRTERDTVLVENAMLRMSRDKELVRATELNTIVRQMSVWLVEGIRRMDDAQRVRQETSMGVGSNDDPPPEFLRTRAELHPLDKEPEEPPVPVPNSHSLIDERLPPVLPRPRDLDQEALLRLGGER